MTKTEKTEQTVELFNVETLKGLCHNQSIILDTMARDNTELIACINMILQDEAITKRLEELKLMAIITNLMDRIAKD